MRRMENYTLENLECHDAIRNHGRRRNDVSKIRLLQQTGELILAVLWQIEYVVKNVVNGLWIMPYGFSQQP